MSENFEMATSVHCKPLSIEYVMYAFYLASKDLHFATFFYHLVA